jgi:hypothetical protein
MNGFHELPDEPLHPFLDSNAWMSVSSSWLDAARYDRAARVLWLRTKQGREYSWIEGCDPETALSFWEAPSKGEWIHRHYPPRR